MKIMINPESKFLSFWQLLVIIAALFSAIFIPISAVFELKNIPIFTILNWAVVGIFWLDILTNFLTSYSRLGKTIKSGKLIADRYLKDGFTIDLLAALPLGEIVPLLGVSVLGPFAKLFYLNRLLKLLRINKFVKRIFSRTNPAIIRLLMLLFWILLAAHFISCAWIYIYGNPDNLGPGSRYIQAFYWTITTLTTIGYGDITPTGNSQTVFVIVIELLGAAMYGLIIGNIANLIANIDVAKSQYKEKMEKINTFLKYRNIPSDMRKKINNYYAYLWESRRGYNESEVLLDLPDALKVSVAIFLNKEIIEKVPIFEGASDEFIKEIIMHLSPVVYTPGDPIVVAGEVGYDMFFISKGSVDVLSADEETLYNTLKAGQFFGEIALLLSMPRTATIRARDYCDLYRLDKDTFDRVLSRYPDFAESIKKLARERRAEIEAIQVEQKKEEAKKVGPKPIVSNEGPQYEDDMVYKAPDRITEIGHQVNEYGIVLSWEKIKDFRHYEIVKRDNKAGKWQYLSKRVTDCEYCDINPETGANTYRIRAVNISGPGPWSRGYTVKIFS